MCGDKLQEIRSFRRAARTFLTSGLIFGHGYVKNALYVVDSVTSTEWLKRGIEAEIQKNDYTGVDSYLQSIDNHVDTIAENDAALRGESLAMEHVEMAQLTLNEGLSTADSTGRRCQRQAAHNRWVGHGYAACAVGSVVYVTRSHMVFVVSDGNWSTPVFGIGERHCRYRSVPSH